MTPEQQALRQLFHRFVVDCYARDLDLDDAEITAYIADMLTVFSELHLVKQLREGRSRPLEDMNRLLFASDPIYGAAPSFATERALRRQIGDYALFYAGMCPELIHAWPNTDGQNFLKLIQLGKDSYHVVSQFNVFEFAGEAPLFARLSANFEACVYGLTQVRRELQLLQQQASPNEQLRLV